MDIGEVGAKWLRSRARVAVDVEFSATGAILAHVRIYIVIEIGRTLHAIHCGSIVECGAHWSCSLLFKCVALTYIVIGVRIVSHP